MYRYRSRELSITNPSMEITAPLLPTIYSSVLLNPQVPCRSLHIHAHQSTRSLRTFVKHKPRFQRPSIFIDFRTPFHNSLTTTCSLPDEAATSGEFFTTTWNTFNLLSFRTLLWIGFCTCLLFSCWGCYGWTFSNCEGEIKNNRCNVRV